MPAHPGTRFTRENNFDFLRFFAATLVLLVHSYPLTGRRPDEPIELLTGYENGGEFAVAIFFVISGYLITSSWINSSSAKSFLIKRALRVFPALILAVLLSAFIIGPLVTDRPLSNYFSSPVTWTYLQNALLITRFELPGVFSQNIYPNVVNGSLWTLPLEVLMYIGVLIMGLVGLLNRRLIFLPIAGLAVGHFWILGMLGIESFFIKNIVKLGLLYYTGAAIFLYRDALPWRGWIAAALVVALALTFHTAAGPYVYVLALPYLVIYLAYAPIPLIARFGKYGDFSYGMYIYAFPFQQLTVYLLGHEIGVFWLTAISLAPTLLLAILSWHLIEAPAMKLKKRFSGAPQAAVVAPKTLV
ncbi:sugar acetylase [Stutzerimonas stutzeri]|uniref:Sugar acetylase n=1 Tax=Stutzerimonas stutzeri TaxID=316 RepID=W8R5W4_STUST|nr:acyltransferase [Stutzerimonas stutzeri]AHL73652.1 sugar acetylase [Stutzerimonas stutzeri]MCQ4328834.1 acyltransferase [Stutzerimonas stutzeri]